MALPYIEVVLDTVIHFIFMHTWLKSYCHLHQNTPTTFSRFMVLLFFTTGTYIAISLSFKLSLVASFSTNLITSSALRSNNCCAGVTIPT